MAIVLVELADATDTLRGKGRERSLGRRPMAARLPLRGDLRSTGLATRSAGGPRMLAIIDTSEAPLDHSPPRRGAAAFAAGSDGGGMVGGSIAGVGLVDARLAGRSNGSAGAAGCGGRINGCASAARTGGGPRGASVPRRFFFDRKSTTDHAGFGGWTVFFCGDWRAPLATSQSSRANGLALDCLTGNCLPRGRPSAVMTDDSTPTLFIARCLFEDRASRYATVSKIRMIMIAIAAMVALLSLPLSLFE
jgi:hypothetical protein